MSGAPVLTHALAAIREKSIRSCAAYYKSLVKHEETIETQSMTITELQKDLHEAVQAKQEVSSDRGELRVGAGADVVSGVVVAYYPGEDSRRARRLHHRIVLRPYRRRPGHH